MALGKCCRQDFSNPRLQQQQLRQQQGAEIHVVLTASAAFPCAFAAAAADSSRCGCESRERRLSSSPGDDLHTEKVLFTTAGLLF
jgi:hypothetical protein